MSATSGEERKLGLSAQVERAGLCASAVSTAHSRVYGACAAEAAASESSGLSVGGCPRAWRYFGPHPVHTTFLARKCGFLAARVHPYSPMTPHETRGRALVGSVERACAANMKQHLNFRVLAGGVSHVWSSCCIHTYVSYQY